MRRLRLQEGRDLSDVIAQPNYLRQLEAREARLNSKDLLLAVLAPSVGMEGGQREELQQANGQRGMQLNLRAEH